MNRILCCLLAATLVVLVPFAGFAEEAHVSPTYEHLSGLEAFVGQWVYKSKVPDWVGEHVPTLKQYVGKPMTRRVNVQWAAGKSAQITRSNLRIGPDYEIQVVRVRGWDNATGKILEHEFTSRGGSWTSSLAQDGDKWISRYVGFNLEGKKGTGVRTIEFKDENTFIVTSTEQTIEGKPLPDETAEFVRVGKPDQQAIEMPQQCRRYLNALVGEWDVVGGEDDDSIVGSITYSWASSENYLKWTAKTWTKGKEDEAVTGDGLMGWDASRQKLKEMAYVSDGASGTAFFTVKGNVLAGIRHGVDAEGRVYTLDMEATLEGKALKFTSAAARDRDGKELVRYSGWVFTRK